MVDGRIADIGRYDDLLARNPEFARLTASGENSPATG